MILSDSSFDMVLIGLIVLAGLFRKNFSGFLPAFCLLSYEIHAQSAVRTENFQLFYIVSWVACTYLIYRYPGRAGSLTLYHAGVSFDPGSAVTLGVGMQAGLSAAPVTMMFLAFFARELWNNRINFSADTRHFLAIAALAWLAVNHYQGMAADLTAQFVAFSAAVLLFFATCSVASDAREQQRMIYAMAAGGVLIVGAAIANQALESASISEFFSRRAWAGTLHPNHLAAWCLAATWALIYAGQNFPLLHQRRRILFIGIFLLLIVLSGARLVMAIACGGLILHFLLIRAGQKPVETRALSGKSGKTGKTEFAQPDRRHLLYGACLIIIVAVSIRFFYKFDFQELARNERLYIWQAAAQLIGQAPVTGHGVLQFALLPQQISDKVVSWLIDWNYPHTHQVFLELLLWGGVPLLIIFLASWLRAFFAWKSAGMIMAVLSVSATLVADFTWRTPAMILFAFFFLLLPRRAVTDSQSFSLRLKVGLSVALIAVMGWLMHIHNGFNSYERALHSLVTGQGSWKPEINQAILRLPFSVDAQMQRLLWKLSREGPDDEFVGQLSQLRQRFPAFWPTLFIEARRAELAGDLHTALELYAHTLNFERADLSGIRNARAAILAARLQDPRLEKFTIETLARGEWGAAMLLHHPQFSSTFKQLASQILVNFQPADFFDAVKLARILKNLAQNGVIVASEFIQRLYAFNLPAWVIDEVVGVTAQGKAITIAEKYAKADYSSTGHLKPRLLSPADRVEIDALADNLRHSGPASLRALAWIRLEQADSGGFLAAYDQMIQEYNYRGKNYEDLAGQYLFARFSFINGEFNLAVEMLQKLMVFDAGNPFLSRLMAKCYLALDQKEQAMSYFNLARQQITFARLDPIFREEPRNLLWPQGDQWIFLFEKVFRRYDADAARYHEKNWKEFSSLIEDQN